MTPEQYFEKNHQVFALVFNPRTDTTVQLRENTEIGFTYISILPIDWTGYDRKIAYNPNFQWGKRREIEWDHERVYPIPENQTVHHPDPRRLLYEMVEIIRELREYIKGRTPDCYGNKEKLLTKTEDFK